MAFTSTPLRKIDYPIDNYCINGDMYFSQRGTYTSATSITTSTYYLDRWQSKITGITGNIQQLTGISQSASTKALRQIATSSATGYLYVISSLEIDQRFYGQYLTLSALVRSNSSLCRMEIQTDVNNTGVTHSGSGDWETLTWTQYITPGTTNLAIFCGLVSSSYNATALTSGQYFDITNVSLTIGQTPREFMPYGGSRISELLACQRYYEKSYSITVAPGTNTSIGSWQVQTTTYTDGRVFIPIRFTAEKMTAPIFSFYRVNGGANLWDYERSGVSGTTTMASTAPSTSGGTIESGGLGLGWVSAIVYGHWVAVSEF